MSFGYRLDAVRPLAETTLRTQNGWTVAWNGVVDTGAPASLDQVRLHVDLRVGAARIECD
jgi:hypothetical protein